MRWGRAPPCVQGTDLAVIMPAPELVWGLLSRGIALVYFISFASMTNFLKTQFRRPEDSLDVAENWTQYAFSDDGSLKPIAKREDPISTASTAAPSFDAT